jgi:predicted metalloprotease with PDZ domain
MAFERIPCYRAQEAGKKLKSLFMRLLLSCFLFITLFSFGQSSKSTIVFTLSIPDPSSQNYHVEMIASGFKEEIMEFKMPAWTPGYYQFLHYAKYVSDFKAVDETNKPLKWEQENKNTWKVTRGKSKEIKITYLSKAAIPFVANSLLDADHGYIMPAGIFMYPQNYLSHFITLTIQNYPSWSSIATGLDRLNNSKNTFTAPDFDTFYDSPILTGNLEELPSFSVQGIPHYFIGYKLGDFDKKQFVADLKKIVETGIGVIGDIPYKHYTFLAIGPVPGGIEHFNSTGFGFSSKGFEKRETLIRMYNFLSHEYFHHYNVKRIRPLELGPFDYEKGSPTTLLWISEGFNNYYDELIVKRARIVSKEEYLKAIQDRITSYENKPGRQFQTASEASYNTWADGPFGRTGDDAYKTISVYEKGSLLGLILDLTIREATQNKKSLDDAMRTLYQEYYQKKKRGFTETEFREVAERIAGQPLTEFFDYVNTVKDLDYKKYLGYAGLDVIEENVQRPEPYFGLTVREKNDTLFVNKVDWESPAWKSDIRSRNVITSVNGRKTDSELFNAALQKKEPVLLGIIKDKNAKEISLAPGTKTERVFRIVANANASDLQKQLLKDWLKD